MWLLTERLRTEGNDEWVRFTVRDSGIGMSEEFLEHAFEPFSQEGNRTLALQWQGTGLGRAIVKKLVVMMHGTIEIHSKLGEGTGVILDLPLTISGVDAPEKMPQAVMAKQNLEGRRVLLAEDNEINTFAVSYTHLDVYKRQPHTRRMRKWWSGAGNISPHTSGSMRKTRC